MTEHEMLELILQKITGLEDKVTGLEDKVTGLENKVTGLEDRMTGFEDRMTGLENKVTGLEDGQQNILQQIDEKITASEERMMFSISPFAARIILFSSFSPNTSIGILFSIHRIDAVRSTTASFWSMTS